MDCGATDSDGDGLSDVWETNGVDLNCDGVPELDLAALGAHPLRKDVFLEIDYMVANDHSHVPSPDALYQVWLAFQFADVLNPDGTKGIDLHIDVSNFLHHYDHLMFGTPSSLNDTNTVNFFDLQNLHFDPARRRVFRYAIFGHSANNLQCKGPNCGGLASGATSLMVTLGTNTSAVAQAQTLMHELGHTFGLLHGGDLDVNQKPNYRSIMNYRYAAGVPTMSGGSLVNKVDYSGQLLATLDETNLNESAGAQGSPNDRLTYMCLAETVATCPADCKSCACGNGVCQDRDCGENASTCPSDCPSICGQCGDSQCQSCEDSSSCSVDCPSAPSGCGDGTCTPLAGNVNPNALASASGFVDWNCNGVQDSGPVLANISGDYAQVGNYVSAAFQTLTGFNDWANLVFKFQCPPSFGTNPAPPQAFLNDLNQDELRALGFLLPIREIGIDVVPGCAANPVAVGSAGTLLQIALLTEGDFVATAVLPQTLSAAGAGAVATSLQDVEGDGDLDLVAWFDSGQVHLTTSSAALDLYGALPSSQTVHGAGPITVVPSLSDGDGDGVSDPCDLCPGTPPGAQVGPNGCPPGAPVAKCKDVVALADTTCHANAIVDDGSFDPNGGSITLAQVPPGPYGLGDTTVALAVSNGAASSSCEALVRVVDVTPPTLQAQLAPSILWPPNHKLTPIQAMFETHDNCDPNSSLVLVSASSSEPDDALGAGDGSTTGDVVAPAITGIKLRAERDASGLGRKYTLVFSAVDAAGNSTSAAALVQVPAHPPKP